MIKKKKITQEDISIWQNYIKNPSDITDKDQQLSDNSFKNFRFKYDLHGFTLFDANKKVKELILYCVENCYKQILLITGKGIHSNTENDTYVSKNLSTLKYSVPEYIKSDLYVSKHVLSISVAEKQDGGEGAIVINLRKL